MTIFITVLILFIYDERYITPLKDDYHMEHITLSSALHFYYIKRYILP